MLRVGSERAKLTEREREREREGMKAVTQDDMEIDNELRNNNMQYVQQTLCPR